ncbi:HalOD1 output domain-containing protein [Halomicrobium sp. HM KBTZ05]|uniref:HalOD1 output domain-containing protein n=1 Tax=Halomicrobium sp. HM KBTZ05 TaxID=3242663 RepID=UPI00355876C9
MTDHALAGSPSTGGQPLSTVVLEAIARYRGVSALDLEFVLYDEIHTEALDQLGRHDGEWQLTITVDGHTVTVDHDRFVTVDGESA